MSEEQSPGNTTGGGDVVDLLLRQHGALRRLCEEVASAAPGSKEEPFRSLVRLMAVHEAVEEEIVHPYVKRRVGASAGVDNLLDEEREVKQMLVALDALGPSGAGFDALFDQFRTTLLAHASKEEKGEFAGLREKTGAKERTAMAAAVRVASTLAPTHPHPGLESQARSVLVGTPMAMIDRARDMLRDAMAARSRTDNP
jgi:hemerythrin superfamily protein